MLFLANFQHVNGSFMKNRTPTKTNDIDENDLLVIYQANSFPPKLVKSHQTFHSVAFLIHLTTFSTDFYLCMFAHFLLDFSQQKVRFAQVPAFSKVAKTEGEVFVTLWASQGDFEPSMVTISPQSPCSLIPGHGILIYSAGQGLIKKRYALNISLSSPWKYSISCGYPLDAPLARAF